MPVAGWPSSLAPLEIQNSTLVHYVFRLFMDLLRPLSPTKRFHVVLAMMFLAVMLVEWGSHSLAFAHSGMQAGMIAVKASGPEHDDPCRTLTTCCERSSNGGMVLSPAHHVPSYNSYVELYDPVPSLSRDLAVIPTSREEARRIFRPKDPLLHPPELS